VFFKITLFIWGGVCVVAVGVIGGGGGFGG
jgi:hypothetical protein